MKKKICSNNKVYSICLLFEESYEVLWSLDPTPLEVQDSCTAGLKWGREQGRIGV